MIVDCFCLSFKISKGVNYLPKRNKWWIWLACSSWVIFESFLSSETLELLCSVHTLYYLALNSFDDISETAVLWSKCPKAWAVRLRHKLFLYYISNTPHARVQWTWNVDTARAHVPCAEIQLFIRRSNSRSFDYVGFDIISWTIKLKCMNGFYIISLTSCSQLIIFLYMDLKIT